MEKRTQQANFDHVLEGFALGTMMRARAAMKDMGSRA